MRWVGVVAVVALLAGFSRPAARVASPGEHVAGASLGLFATDPDYDYGPLLDELVDRGATDVLLVDALVQETVHATALERRPGRSATLATLARTMSQANERGLRVAWMPIVVVEDRARGEWRGVLEPGEGGAAWFASYREHVRAGAELAQEHGAARVVVGSELTSLQSLEGGWRAIIADVRGRFDGAVTYAANWDAYEAVPFWDALDEVGVSAYFPLAREAGARMTRDDAATALERPLAALVAFGERTERPVLLLEVGFPAHADAATTPWDETRPAPLAPELQAALLGGFCDAERGTDLNGFYVWNWFGRGGPRDAGYSPRGKPAAAVFETCMRDVNDRRRGRHE